MLTVLAAADACLDTVQELSALECAQTYYVAVSLLVVNWRFTELHNRLMSRCIVGLEVQKQQNGMCSLLGSLAEMAKRTTWLRSM